MPRFASLVGVLALTIGLLAAPASAAPEDVTAWVVSSPDGHTLGNGVSSQASVSGDGRYVAFASTSTNLAATDTDETSDIYVKDLQTGDLAVVSTSAGGQKGNGESRDPSISADGTHVAFASRATNLLPADTDDVTDVYVKSLVNGGLALASTDGGATKGDGDSTLPSLNGNGGVVAFGSSASNLDPNGGGLFVKTLSTGGLKWISSTPPSSRRAISDDGSRVIADAVYDASTGDVIENLPGYEPTQDGDGRQSIAISGDGQFLAYVAWQDFDPGLTAEVAVKFQLGSGCCVETHEFPAAHVDGVALSADGSGFAYAAPGGVFMSPSPDVLGIGGKFPSLSGDGSLAGYERAGQVLARAVGTPLVTDFGIDVAPVAAGPEGSSVPVQGSVSSGNLLRSAYGPTRGFADVSNLATQFTPADDGTSQVRLRGEDLFGAVAEVPFAVTATNVAPAISGAIQATTQGNAVHIQAAFGDPGLLDTHTATIDWGDGSTTPGDVTEAENVPATPASKVQSNGLSGSPSISDDGRFVAFSSQATNLGQDPDPAEDVFIHDRSTHTTRRVSQDQFFEPRDPHISPSGDLIAFDAQVATQAWDRRTQMTEVAGTDDFGSPIRSSTPDESAGRTVSGDDNLVLYNAANNLWLYDRALGARTLVPGSDSFDRALGGSVSADGNMVGYATVEFGFDVEWFHPMVGQMSPPGVLSFDEELQGREGHTAISPDGGAFVYDHEGGGLTERQLANPDVPEYAMVPELQSPSPALDGRKVAVGTSDFLSGLARAAVYDFDTGQLEEIGVNSAEVPGNGNESSPQMSSDARYVTFASDSTNLVTGDTNGVEDVFVRDRVLGTTERVSVAGSTGRPWLGLVDGSHTYAQPGTYTVHLCVRDDDGGEGCATKQVTVAAQSQDLVAVAFTGGITYTNRKQVSTNAVTVTRDALGIKRVVAHAVLPGTKGGLATVDIAAQRFGPVPVFYGATKVVDAGAHINTITPMIKARLKEFDDGRIRNTSKGVDLSHGWPKPYTLTWTVLDSNPPPAPA